MPEDDPCYVWSGETQGKWAISLRRRSGVVDLTGPAKIRWRAKQSGFRQLRIILKTAEGAWLVSHQADDDSLDWRVREFNLADMRWRMLDIEQVVEGGWAKNPDLSRVIVIGASDLMRGGGSPASSRLDWIEVYGRPGAAR